VYVALKGYVTYNRRYALANAPPPKIPLNEIELDEELVPKDYMANDPDSTKGLSLMPLFSFRPSLGGGIFSLN